MDIPITAIQRAVSSIEAEIEQSARIGSVLSRPSEHTAGFMKGLRTALSLVREAAAESGVTQDSTP